MSILHAGAALTDLLRLIRAEYLEVPGLSLTEPQAQRLWGLDTATCGAILATLIDLKFLRRTRLGSYVRADQSVG